MMSSPVIGNTIALKPSKFLEIFTEVFDGEKSRPLRAVITASWCQGAIQVASWLRL